MLVIVYFFAKHHQTHRNVYLYWGLAFVSMIALTRYLGYYAFVLTTLYLVLYLWQNRLYRSLEAVKLLMLLALSAVPSSVWVLRNFFVDGTLHGPREESDYSLVEATVASFTTLVVDNYWVLIGGAIMGGILWFQAKERMSLRVKTAFSEPKSVLHSSLWLFGSSFLLYFTLVIYSASIAKFDPIGTRFLAPVYPFLVFLFGVLLTRFYNGLVKEKQRKWFQIAIILMMFAYTAIAFVNATELYTGSFDVENKLFWNGYILSF